MKLYLSSYPLGKNADTFSSMVAGNRRIAVIRNALDFSNDIERLSSGKEQEIADLNSLGFDAEELDLKEYFDKKSELLEVLKSFDGTWVVGGNSFILRWAMRESGFDTLLKAQSLGSEFVYAGYSAGICVISFTLRGIDNIDAPDIVPEGYPIHPIWDGVGLLPFAIAPHYKSDHPESKEIDNSITYFINHKIPFIALRDGEAYIGETSPSV